MTISNEKKLIETLCEFLQHQLIHHSKNGVLIQLDGSLVSLVNHKIAELIKPKISIEHMIIVFNENKFNILNLNTSAASIGANPIFYDASNFPIPFQQNSSSSSSRKRVEDLILGVKADINNLSILGNLCYSEWCIDFPHNSFKNSEHLFLMNRLFYSEVQQLARYLNIPEQVINREPILNFNNGKTAKDILGFSFSQLEAFLRSDKSIICHQHFLIQQRLLVDDKLTEFNSPIFQRPCSFLS